MNRQTDTDTYTVTHTPYTLIKKKCIDSWNLTGEIIPRPVANSLKARRQYAISCQHHSYRRSDKSSLAAWGSQGLNTLQALRNCPGDNYLGLSDPFDRLKAV